MCSFAALNIIPHGCAPVTLMLRIHAKRNKRGSGITVQTAITRCSGRMLSSKSTKVSATVLVVHHIHAWLMLWANALIRLLSPDDAREYAHSCMCSARNWMRIVRAYAWKHEIYHTLTRVRCSSGAAGQTVARQGAAATSAVPPLDI